MSNDNKNSSSSVAEEEFKKPLAVNQQEEKIDKLSYVVDAFVGYLIQHRSTVPLFSGAIKVAKDKQESLPYIELFLRERLNTNEEKKQFLSEFVSLVYSGKVESTELTEMIDSFKNLMKIYLPLDVPGNIGLEELKDALDEFMFSLFYQHKPTKEEDSDIDIDMFNRPIEDIAHIKSIFYVKKQETISKIIEGFSYSEAFAYNLDTEALDEKMKIEILKMLDIDNEYYRNFPAEKIISSFYDNQDMRYFNSAHQYIAKQLKKEAFKSDEDLKEKNLKELEVDVTNKKSVDYYVETFTNLD